MTKDIAVVARTDNPVPLTTEYLPLSQFFIDWTNSVTPGTEINFGRRINMFSSEMREGEKVICPSPGLLLSPEAALGAMANPWLVLKKIYRQLSFGKIVDGQITSLLRRIPDNESLRIVAVGPNTIKIMNRHASEVARGSPSEMTEVLRFIDDDQVFIFKNNIKRNILAHQTARHRRRHTHFDLRARFNGLP